MANVSRHSGRSRPIYSPVASICFYAGLPPGVRRFGVTRIEKLIPQILCVSHAPRIHHGFLLDPHYRAIGPQRPSWAIPSAYPASEFVVLKAWGKKWVLGLPSWRFAALSGDSDVLGANGRGNLPGGNEN